VSLDEVMAAIDDLSAELRAAPARIGHA